MILRETFLGTIVSRKRDVSFWVNVQNLWPFRKKMIHQLLIRMRIGLPSCPYLPNSLVFCMFLIAILNLELLQNVCWFSKVTACVCWKHLKWLKIVEYLHIIIACLRILFFKEYHRWNDVLLSIQSANSSKIFSNSDKELEITYIHASLFL